MSDLKRYVGDGVYADYSEHGELVLTTENGIEVTNTIVLEPEVWKALKLILKEWAYRGVSTFGQ